jgi:hypothetical protein
LILGQDLSRQIKTWSKISWGAEVIIDPDPLIPEEMEKAIREMPRDTGVIDLLETLSGEVPLPEGAKQTRRVGQVDAATVL